MNRFIKSEVVYIFKPLGFIALIAFLFIQLFRIGTSEINKVRSNLSELKAESAKLNTKYSVLTSVTSNLSNDNPLFGVAVPNKSSALFGLSQIKKMALENSLLLSNLKSASPTLLDNDISSISIAFDTEGSYQSVFQFLQAISKALPIMNITKLELTQQSEVLRASITLNVYTAPLPKVIPSLTTAVNDLTPQEMQLISEFEGFSGPTFVELSPQVNEGKEDLFVN